MKRSYVLRSAAAGVLEYVGAVLGRSNLHSVSFLLHHGHHTANLAHIVLIMVATLWRIPSLVRIYRNMRAMAAARTPGVGVWVRAQIGWLFVAWLQDLPFIPLFVLTLPFVWRSRVLIRQLRQVRRRHNYAHTLIACAITNLSPGDERQGGTAHRAGSCSLGACRHSVGRCGVGSSAHSVAAAFADIETQGTANSFDRPTHVCACADTNAPQRNRGHDSRSMWARCRIGTKSSSPSSCSGRSICCSCSRS
jgi:hypothetical protein